MIQIRSVTYNMPQIIKEETLKKTKHSIDLWEKQPFFIRTKRISCVPISDKMAKNEIEKIIKICNECDIRWFNIPINPWDRINDRKQLFKFAYSILKNYPQAFVNVLCIKDGEIDFDILNDSIELIKNTANISNNGKDNFRLGLSTNVKPNCPFFPFSYSSGKLSFSIALELTQEINAFIKENKMLNLSELRDCIISNILPQIKQIEEIAKKISEKTGIEFVGFDFSLAPIIDENGSIITILKHIGIDEFGKNGTMFATAYLTNILKFFGNFFKTVGFSGVMYSLLEDLELCKINNEIGVTLEELIKLSTMCGCGVDMVPISADVANDVIKTIILDVAAISCRLNKPLGIRLLPISKTQNGKEAYTNFNEDADFISNTKILNISNNEILDNKIKSFKLLDLNKNVL